MDVKRKDLIGAPIDVTGNMIKVLFACSGNLDRVGDILSDTALATAQTPVPLMWRHFLELLPLGSVERIERQERQDLPRDVRQSFPDVTGGWVAHARVYKTERGRELIDMLNDGFVGGASFGYKVLKDRPGRSKKGKPARILDDVALFEVSVLEPGGQANPAAMTIKSYAAERASQQATIAEVKALLHADDMLKLRDKMRRNQRLIELDDSLRSIGVDTGLIVRRR